MIIYKTQLGDREKDEKAIELREKYKPLLKGVSCHVCSKDSQITWDKEKNMSPVIKACCKDYEKKILNILKISINQQKS